MKKMFAVFSAVASMSVFAQNSAPAGSQDSSGNCLSDIVSIEAAVNADSRYVYYGLVENYDPVVRPSASITFFDWFYVGVEAYFDVTKYGKKAGWGNRAGRYTELYGYAGIAHEFSPEDYEWLPTKVEFDLYYTYEYQPNSKGRYRPIWGNDENWAGDDSAYVTLELGLPDLWFEPSFLIERDIMRDNGTYAQLEIGHTFDVVSGATEEDDAIVTLRPSVAQGIGNTQRMRGYLCNPEGEALDHAGLMDTVLKLELEWKACENLTIGGYVAYSDFLFDRKIRHAARDYEMTGRWDESWNFLGGVSVKLEF